MSAGEPEPAEPTAEPGPPEDPVVFALFNEIGIIEQLARNRLERELPDGLLLPHFTVLNHLVRLGDDKSPVQLARAFQVTKGAMTNTLQRLETRGLITLRPDPSDGRGKRVRLTAAGRRMREDAVRTVTRIAASVEAALGHDAFEAALPFLRQLRQHLDAERDRGPSRP